MVKSWRKIDLDKIFTHALNECISVTKINSALLFIKLPLPGKKPNQTKTKTIPKNCTFKNVDIDKQLSYILDPISGLW